METKQKDSYTVSPDELARCLKRSVPTDEVYKVNTYSKIGYRVSLERIESLLSDAVAKYGHNVKVENNGTAVLIRK
jgi:hypothetical protein